MKKFDGAFAGNCSEVAVVQCDHRRSSSFGAGDHCSVSQPNMQIFIASDELPYPSPVLQSTIEFISAGFDVLDEDDQCTLAQVTLNKMRNLSQDRDGDDQAASV